jgi:hypothetical protein
VEARREEEGSRGASGAGEAVHAFNKEEGLARIRSELLDVACVAMRLYMGEVDEGEATVGLRKVRMKKESDR